MILAGMILCLSRDNSGKVYLPYWYLTALQKMTSDRLWIRSYDTLRFIVDTPEFEASPI